MKLFDKIENISLITSRLLLMITLIILIINGVNNIREAAIHKEYMKTLELCAEVLNECYYDSKNNIYR